MKHLPSMLTALALGAAALSPAMANQELAQKKACLNCHGVDKAVLGPSFKDVAAKYKGKKDAEAKLVQKVLNGGGGVWNMPMGPMPAQKGNVSEAEAKQLVKWVLSAK
jgi:cytochrome c